MSALPGATDLHDSPLKGVRVLDISRVLAGPYCAQMLADMGAEVIKIESPEGDENRAWGTRCADGITCNFASVNRGKRSITLNLKHPRAREILRDLVLRADVVIQSFLPDTAERLGVDYASIKAVKPSIIHCTISGYGAQGPLANKPGYDLMMQAFSGMMSTTGYEGGPPVRIGVSVIDMSTGMAALNGILAALFRGARGNPGGAVQVSLLQTAISLLGYHAVTFIEGGVMPRREGSGVLHLAPYQAFVCSDGYVLAGATNDAAWRRFCKAIDRDDLACDPRFASNDLRVENKAVLIGLLEVIFRARTVGEWVERFDRQGVAAAPLLGMDEIMSHPQVLANEMLITARAVDGRAVKLIGMPFKLSGMTGPASEAAPPLGHHTTEVLQSHLGFSAQTIEQLRAEGVL